MQHCEVTSLRELYPRWFPARWRRSWNEGMRPHVSLAACHPSVIKRFELPAIRKLGVTQPYRPEALRGDPDAAKYYERASTPETAA